MTNKEFFANAWKSESAITAKAVRSLPNDSTKLKYTHHPRFRSPWEIVNHIGPHGKELAQAISAGRMDLINEGKYDLTAAHIYKSPEEAAKAIEENAANLLKLASSVDDKTWESKIIPVYWGTQKIFEMPLGQLCWTMHFDTIHHRGQLSSYYRSLGVTQPNLYGPTSEEEEAMMAKSI